MLGVARATVRYTRRFRSDEPALRKRIRKLAAKHKRYGSHRIWVALRREDWRVNEKRVHRLWKDEGLQILRKAKKRRACGPSVDLPMRAEYPGHVWSYDFIEDRTERGGKLRLLCIVDEYTRECLAIRAEPSIGAAKVVDVLDWLFLVHGTPAYLRSDNGSEFVAKALRTWLGQRGPKTLFITPGSPWENPYIESFHGKFRDECLNMHVFTDVRHAQQVVEAWRKEYNEERPHRSLHDRTPAEFAAHCRNSGRPTASLRSGNAEAPGAGQQIEANPLTLSGT